MTVLSETLSHAFRHTIKKTRKMKNLKTSFKFRFKALLFAISLLIFAGNNAFGFELIKDNIDSVSHDKCCTKTFSKNKITSIPFNYKNRIINFKAKINGGKKDFDFVLDTGAPTFITDSVLNEHSLELLNSTDAVDANQNKQGVNIYRINSISFNDKNINNVEAAHSDQIHNMAVLKDRANGGLIGANVMKHSIWMIDFASNEIKITDKIELLNIPENAFITKMSKDIYGSPVITVDIGDKKRHDFVIDLAYNGSVLLPASYFSKPIFVDSLTYVKNEKLSTGFASDVKQNSYHFLKKFESGNLNLSNVKCSSSGRNTRALIGNEFLENYIVIFDFIHNKFIMIPRNDIGIS